MTNRYILIRFTNILVLSYWGIFLISCDTRPKVIPYRSYFDLQAENIDGSNLEREQGSFLFYDERKIENDSYIMVGRFVNGFRDGPWQYQYTKDSIRTIIWAMYKDKYIDIKTNVFAKIDSVIYKDTYTLLKFKTDREKVKLAIGLNSVLANNVKDNNYLDLLTRSLNEIDVEVVSSSQINLKKIYDNYYAYKLKCKRRNDTAFAYLCTFCGRLNDSTTFDFSIQTNVPNSFYSELLFDALISNTYVNNTRLYNPW